MGKPEIQLNQGLSWPLAFSQSAEPLAPADEFQWNLRSCRIADGLGRPVLELDKVEAPVLWSQQAVNIVARQYLRRSLPDGSSETSVRRLIDRVVKTIEKFGFSAGYFNTPGDSQIFRDELSRVLLQQRASFNSPVWFNCGLWTEYGARTAGGNWAWSEANKQAVEIDNNYERPQCSACFIQSIDDNMGSIFDLVSTEARLFKYGSGTGTNFSNLRSRHEALSGGGESSGLISFLEVFDRAAGATKSGGTNRRAAKMVCLDLDHPEILDFIRWKAKEEAKAQALIAAGFSPGMDGEAYRSVSGQNSNNSIRITDSFMNAVASDGAWNTRSRLDGRVVETLKARNVFRAIAESAWVCADPGVQYDSAIQKWNTCADTEPIRASNPCSEFMFLDDTACNLASINLLKFLDDDNRFDFGRFRAAIRLLIVAQDILVDFASYPTRKIAERAHRYRPLGLGYANLGAVLMAQGLAYDSEAGRSWAAAVTALMTGEAYAVSAEVAGVKGAFAAYAANKSSMSRVLALHHQHAQKLKSPHEIVLEAQASWGRALAQGEKFGYRNSQVTVLAPTGTIAFMMDCDTTGIEPEFALVKSKALAGGGSMIITNQTIERALRRLGYAGEQVDSILKTIHSSGTWRGSGIKPHHESVFHCATEIAPLGHLKMMAVVQPFLSGAVSKTVNLPADTTVEEIEQIFSKGWELGLKAVAVYREGSKSAQPLKSHSIAANSIANKSAGKMVCPICDYPTVVSGSCWVCPQCGHSLACS